jgi:hypothetical protein
MKSKDYIPHQEPVFYLWLKNLIYHVSQMAIAWEIPVRVLNKVLAFFNDYEIAYQTTLDPSKRTKSAVQIKNDARKILIAEIRLLCQGHLLHNDLVTNADRDTLKLPIYDPSHSPEPAPPGHPEGTINTAIHQQHGISVKDSDEITPRGGLPRYAHGFETWHHIGTALPTKDSDFTYVNFSSSTSMKVYFDLSDVGKNVFYRFRWVNSRNMPGEWSGIVQATIP